MKKKISPIHLLGLAALAVLLIFGISGIVKNRIANQIEIDFHDKICDFENTVDGRFHDPVCGLSHDIRDAETTGRVELKPVTHRDTSWYEFNTYITVKIYVDRDMSLMNPFAVRSYLKPLKEGVGKIVSDYLKSDFPLAYYRSEEGLDKLGKYLYHISYIADPVDTEVYVIDSRGDEYRYASYYAYYVNGECVEKPFLSIYSSGSSSGSSGSGHGSSGSGHGSAYPDDYDHAWDVDDYDDPGDYADDAWGEDFDDWDDAYDYWEDNY